VKQDQRLSGSALYIVKADAINLDELPLRRIFALGFFGQALVDIGGRGQNTGSGGECSGDRMSCRCRSEIRCQRGRTIAQNFHKSFHVGSKSGGQTSRPDQDL